MEPATTPRFAAAARTLAAEARRSGLVSPSFRSPPRLSGVDRSLVRRRGASAVVAVRLRDRPWAAVLADMVEGVVAANRLEGAAADRCRARLWAALEAEREVTPPGAVILPLAARSRVA